MPSKSRLFRSRTSFTRDCVAPVPAHAPQEVNHTLLRTLESLSSPIHRLPPQPVSFSAFATFPRLPRGISVTNRIVHLLSCFRICIPPPAGKLRDAEGTSTSAVWRNVSVNTAFMLSVSGTPRIHGPRRAAHIDSFSWSRRVESLTILRRSSGGVRFLGQTGRFGANLPNRRTETDTMW